MKTAQIDLLSVTKNNGVFTVEYWDESCENENNSTVQIHEDRLHEFIDSNYTVDDDIFDVVPTHIYLYENLHEVIKDYITANS